MPHLIQTGLWRWTKGTGLERFELLQMAHEWILRGTIVALAKHGPADARYEVVCDDSWHTRRADISLRDERGERILRVAVEKGQWYENGRTTNVVTGCVDIDLEWSPSTNIIPIRRLRLAVGERSELIIAAWVRFPDLALQSLPQKYERTSERCYGYISGGVANAQLCTDENGELGKPLPESVPKESFARFPTPGRAIQIRRGDKRRMLGRLHQTPKTCVRLLTTPQRPIYSG